jgi:hypothetical protein
MGGSELEFATRVSVSADRARDDLAASSFQSMSRSKSKLTSRARYGRSAVGSGVVAASLAAAVPVESAAP